MITTKIKMPSNLITKDIQDCKIMAQDIASETFVKNGNNALSFTDNHDLRMLVGGRYESYPELSKVIIAAYNEKLCDLIIANL